MSTQSQRQHLAHEAAKLRDGYKGCHECVPRPVPVGTGSYGWLHCSRHRCEALATYPNGVKEDPRDEPCKHACEFPNPRGPGQLCTIHGGLAALGKPIKLRPVSDGGGDV